MTDRELEKLFKDKLDSRQFDFNPANWQAMEAMLDRGAKKGSFYLLSTLAILIYGGIITSLILFNPVHQAAAVKNINHVPTEISSLPAEQTKESSNSEASSKTADENPVEGLANNSEEDIDPVPSVSEIVSTPGYQKPGGMEKEAIASALDEGEISIREDIIDLNQASLPLLSMVTGETGLAFTRSDALIKFQKQREWYLLAGVNLNTSYNNGEAGVGWLFGIEYQQRLQKNWSFNIGAQYTRQRNVGITEVSDSTFYSFGQTRLITTTETRAVDYLELPARVIYHLNPAHQIEGGAYAAIRLKVDQLTTKDQFSIKGHEKLSSDNGGHNSIELWDAGLTAAYRYNYSPQLSFGIQIKYGLMDITRDATPAMEQQHRNINTRFTLRYRLF